MAIPPSPKLRWISEPKSVILLCVSSSAIANVLTVGTAEAAEEEGMVCGGVLDVLLERIV